LWKYVKIKSFKTAKGLKINYQK